LVRFEWKVGFEFGNDAGLSGLLLVVLLLPCEAVRIASFRSSVWCRLISNSA